MKGLLRAGAIAGGIGGLCSALFLRVVGERSIDAAVALEEAAADSQTHDELFSRSAQHLGGMLGIALAGVVFGVVLAVVFGRTRHRLPGRTDWHRALFLGGVAWLMVNLVPALKYPPNPPAVGDPDTVGTRTGSYLLLLLFCVLAAVAAAALVGWLRSRGIDEQLRAVAGVAAFVALTGIALVAFPASPDAVDAPTQLVWRFRLQSLGGTLLLWTVTAAALGRMLAPPVRRTGDDRRFVNT